MIREFTPRAQTKKGDGELVAALLFMLAAATAIAIIGFSYLTQGPIDSLIARTPTSAIVYLHANGATAVRTLSTHGPLPLPDVTPTELAFYATADDGKKLQWHALATWRWPYAPTEEDREALDAARGIFLDDRTARIGGDLAADASFGATEEVASALADARARAHMQAYVDLASMTGLLSVEKIGSPSGIALSIVANEGRALARATTVGGATVDDGTRFDPFTLLFGPFPDTDDRALTMSASDAANFLDRHVRHVAIDQAGTPKATVQLSLSGTDVRTTMDKVGTYAGLRWPTRMAITLPDGDGLTELRLHPTQAASFRIGESAADVRSIERSGNDIVIGPIDAAPFTKPRACGKTENTVLTLKLAKNEGLRTAFYWLPYGTLAISTGNDRDATICAYK